MWTVKDSNPDAPPFKGHLLDNPNLRQTTIETDSPAGVIEAIEEGSGRAEGAVVVQISEMIDIDMAEARAEYEAELA